MRLSPLSTSSVCSRTSQDEDEDDENDIRAAMLEHSHVAHRWQTSSNIKTYKTVKLLAIVGALSSLAVLIAFHRDKSSSLADSSVLDRFVAEHWTTFRTWSSCSKAVDDTKPKDIQRLSEACQDPHLDSLRNNASFWTIKTIRRELLPGEATTMTTGIQQDGHELALRIEPVNETLAEANCPQLSMAAFHVLLHYDERHRNETRVVHAKPVQSSMGVYLLSPLPKTSQSATNDVGSGKVKVTIEARLEFGWFPGQRSGQPCVGIECQPNDLSAFGVEYSGEEIWPAASAPKNTLTRRHGAEHDRMTKHVKRQSQARLEIYLEPSSLDVKPQETGKADLCDVFHQTDAAVAGPEGRVSYLAANGRPCHLRPFPTATSEVPFDNRDNKSVDAFSTQSETGGVNWIHLIGDSNSRRLIIALAMRLGSKDCRSHTSEGQKRPTTWVCFNSEVAEPQLGSTTYVLSFSWYFLTPPSDGIDDAKAMDAIDLSSLPAFIKSIAWTDQHKWPQWIVGTDSPLHISSLFLSIGSHAPTLTRRGLWNRLDLIRDAFERKMNASTQTFLLTTTAVEAALIPKKWGSQSTMRNNVMIDVRNHVLRQWVDATFSSGRDPDQASTRMARVVDTFTMTRALSRNMKKDAVHFERPVYDELAQLAWTAEGL
ncbi:hypothetical protein OIO90_005468 [Microbotryomycetes sp. JL221]|nr:hypothetical protein OIO90_005468 [Microbotryomycetes sp. JL221]